MSAARHHFAAKLTRPSQQQLRGAHNDDGNPPSDPRVDPFIVFGAGSWPKQHVQHLYDVEFLRQRRPSLATSAFTRWLRSLFKRVNPELQVGPLS